MVKTVVKKQGMASWARAPMEVSFGDRREIFLGAVGVLRGLREEYTPDVLPVSAMFKDGRIVKPYWRAPNGDWHFTLRGWIQALRHTRAQLSAIDEALWKLEEAFLDLYPPFGEFIPPIRIPWTPGTVKSGSRFQTVEYSLTSVFDTKILPGKGGWAALQRLISRAIWFDTDRKNQRTALKNIWDGVLEEQVQKKQWEYYLFGGLPPMTMDVG